MVGRYTAGYRLERRVQALYSEFGWLATRFPTSGRRLHPADILALKRAGDNTSIHLVECKNASKKGVETIYLGLEQVERLLKAAGKHLALALIAYSFPYQRVRVVRADALDCSGKMLCVRKGDGVLMKRFLSGLR